MVCAKSQHTACVDSRGFLVVSGWRTLTVVKEKLTTLFLSISIHAPASDDGDPPPLPQSLKGADPTLGPGVVTKMWSIGSLYSLGP